ncbi:MAG TPA: xanthine dehydrogenase family protein molybdopterin-binding subunit [Alphaproteobacteria bacterium]|nr:xanthine dehydrogenase family protein molybdopterin-binding subunit [Alphaproteobacteria bacterium]
MNSMIDLRSSPDRRSVLKGMSLAGAGLIIGFYVPMKGAQAQFAMREPPSVAPNFFLRIAPDNTLTVISKHTEMGQGIYTGLATLIAEEMDADWSQVRVESAPVNVKIYVHLMLGMQGTGGSSSIPNSWDQYRMVGANARHMLIAAVAEKWKVPADEITVSKGVIMHKASGKKGSFGEFAEAAAKMPVPKEVRLKDPNEYKLIGTHLTKVDSVAKSHGTATYTIDTYRADALTAVVARSPRFGGRVKSFAAAEARKVKGVVDVVEIPKGVAVLATGMYPAMKGREALTVEWDDSKAEMRGTEEIIADFTAMARKPGAQVEKKGDSAKAIDGASKKFEATFVFPYLAHACMEPLDYIIERGSDGKYHVHAGTQMQSVEQGRIAEALGVKPDDVTIKTLLAGGGFGRRGNFVADLDVDSAMILKASGEKHPIKLAYTREDDTTAGYYRPLFVHKMRGGIDEKGNIVGWENTLVGQSFVKGTFLGMMVQHGVDPLAVEGAHEMPYEFPNVSVDYHMAEAGVPTLAWRSVGNTHTAYSREMWLDEMLYAGGRDPVQARLDMMKDERGKAVIELAAEKAGWGRVLPEGRAFGMAYVMSFSTRVCEIVEVSLKKDGTPKVERVVAAVDCGQVVNPDIVKAQVDGAVGFGLTAALYGDIKMEKGVVLTKNFDTYKLLRIEDMPKVEVYIMPSHERPSGIGEPGVPPIAPAVGNALFRLTGKRVYRLPMIKA